MSRERVRNLAESSPAREGVLGGLQVPTDWRAISCDGEEIRQSDQLGNRATRTRAWATGRRTPLTIEEWLLLPLTPFEKWMHGDKRVG